MTNTLRPTLVRTRSTQLGQFLYQIHQFEDSIEKHTDWKIVNGLPLPRRRLPVLFVSILARLLRFIRSRIDWKSRRHYLSIGFLSPDRLHFKTFPYFDLPARFRLLWAYDIWEKELPDILRSIKTHNIKLVFLSSQQSTARLAEMSNGFCECFWLPEAVDAREYHFKPPAERRIDVLQLGRRWDEYHFRIEPFCRDNAMVYRYEKIKGEIIFPKRADFLAALAETRISICVPSAITHPERSGDISTMTWRYLESMASKCLVLGRAPTELKELFDYDPMIEIDMNRPAKQLRELLHDLPRYQDLIERNYEYVVRHHQWKNRIARMKECLVDFARRHPEWIEDGREVESRK